MKIRGENRIRSSWLVSRASNGSNPHPPSNFKRSWAHCFWNRSPSPIRWSNKAKTTLRSAETSYFEWITESGTTRHRGRITSPTWCWRRQQRQLPYIPGYITISALQREFSHSDGSGKDLCSCPRTASRRTLNPIAYCACWIQWEKFCNNFFLTGQ